MYSLKMILANVLSEGKLDLWEMFVSDSSVFLLLSKDRGYGSGRKKMAKYSYIESLDD